jgi:hypothetical protein
MHVDTGLLEGLVQMVNLLAHFLDMGQQLGLQLA